MTTAQIKYVRGLLAKVGLSDQKDDLVRGFTNGRTTHLTEMNHAETNALIKALVGGETVSPRDMMIRKILSIAHTMKWQLADGKVDMNRINAWCVKYSKEHKGLDQISNDQLPSVVTQFEKVYSSFLKGF